MQLLEEREGGAGLWYIIGGWIELLAEKLQHMWYMVFAVIEVDGDQVNTCCMEPSIRWAIVRHFEDRYPYNMQQMMSVPA